MRPQLNNVQSVRYLGALSHKWDVLFKSLLLELREPLRKRGRKSIRTRGDGGSPGNITRIDAHTDSQRWRQHAHTEPALLCATWGPTAEKRSVPMSPSLAQKLPAISNL